MGLGQMEVEKNGKKPGSHNHILGPPNWMKEITVLKIGLNPKCIDTSYIVNSHDSQ